MSRVVFVLLFFVSSVAAADSRIVGHMLPLEEERLQDPIILPHCPGVRVIEWRATVGQDDTGQSEAATNELDELCSLAVNSFHAFLVKQRIAPRRPLNGFHEDICLMPADIYNHGTQYRNLNDNKYRFASRKHKEIRYIWGYSDQDSSTVFLRNDVLTSDGREIRFSNTFTHELYHAMALYTGIYYTTGEDSDEDLANRFTRFLGL